MPVRAWAAAPSASSPRPTTSNRKAAGEASRGFPPASARTQTPRTTTGPRMKSRLNRAYGTRSAILSPNPAKKSPSHGRVWTFWVTALSTAVENRPTPVKSTPRMGIRRPEAVATTSAAMPRAGTSNTSVAGWVSDHPIQVSRSWLPPKPGVRAERWSTVSRIRSPSRTGKVSRVTTEPTSEAQANAGTRRRVIPGARDVSTVVASAPAAIMRPSRARPNPARNSSTILASPPPGPPLPMKATSTSAEPKNHDQKPSAPARPKASPRAPSCNGTTAMASPRSNGPTTMKGRATR